MNEEQMSMPKHGDFCWAEIATTDAEKCKDFYNKVFGWEFHSNQPAAAEMEYTHYGLPGEEPIGGMYTMLKEMFGENMPPPHFMNYIAVDDVDALAQRTTELGGKVHMPPMDIPNTGRFCVIEDPTGAYVSLITLIP